MKVIIGNQNSGKTTLFNQLTKSNQKVANFPGVDFKEGLIFNTDIVLVDLPGIMSLTHTTRSNFVLYIK